MRRKLRNTYVLIKLLGESFSFAYGSVKANKLRTFLSLLGVTIGIFSIISVFTMVDALEDNIRKGIESLGSNVIYIQKWPWGEVSEGQWWEYRQRPRTKYEEFTYLQNNLRGAEAVAFIHSFQRQLKYKTNTTSRVIIYGITHDWDKMTAVEIEEGRYFSPMEINGGVNVAIIGRTLADELFGDDYPIGRVFSVAGRKTRVIGLFKKQGNMFAMNYDNTVVMPLHYAVKFADIRRGNQEILVKAKQGASMDDLHGELRMMMRALRRLSPSQKDNFALNEMSVISRELNPILGTLNLAGWIIGGLSILIGGFGVANIMFVSVKERTPIIGIQKSLGAKNYFILTQFLFEAVLLTVAGGLLGLLLVFAATTLVTHAFDFAITLTLINILRGILISTLVGILSGIVPAWTASRLSPVVAIGH
ncbi:MAG: ABC transporter permease [Prevotellaceae bacterium]|jgi:putative ABC transport system permease protein|nr:ABC transporter permease [Prevotellaceae bacterium]